MGKAEKYKQLLALGNNGNHFKVLVFCCSCCLFVFIISKLEMQKQDLFLEDASIIRWFKRFSQSFRHSGYYILGLVTEQLESNNLIETRRQPSSYSKRLQYKSVHNLYAHLKQCFEGARSVEV